MSKHPRSSALDATEGLTIAQPGRDDPLRATAMTAWYRTFSVAGQLPTGDTDPAKGESVVG